FALHQLDDFSPHQINRRDQHGLLMGTPALLSFCLSSEMFWVPKWKIEAARAASAFPPRNTSTKCWTDRAPPEAITGICTAALTPAVNSQSKPLPVPSRSIEVSRISPAPKPSASLAHATASRPVGLRPPAMNTCQLPFAALFASIATTTA